MCLVYEYVSLTFLNRDFKWFKYGELFQNYQCFFIISAMTQFVVAQRIFIHEWCSYYIFFSNKFEYDCVSKLVLTTLLLKLYYQSTCNSLLKTFL